MTANSQVRTPINWNLWAWVALLGGGIYAYHRLTSDAKDAAAAVDPTNPGNVANTFVNKVVRALSGDKTATAGSKIYDATHPGEAGRLSAPITLKEVNAVRAKAGKLPYATLKGPNGKPVVVQLDARSAELLRHANAERLALNKPPLDVPNPASAYRLIYGRGQYSWVKK